MPLALLNVNEKNINEISTQIIQKSFHDTYLPNGKYPMPEILRKIFKGSKVIKFYVEYVQ